MAHIGWYESLQSGGRKGRRVLDMKGHVSAAERRRAALCHRNRCFRRRRKQCLSELCLDHKAVTPAGKSRNGSSQTTQRFSSQRHEDCLLKDCTAQNTLARNNKLRLWAIGLKARHALPQAAVTQRSFDVCTARSDTAGTRVAAAASSSKGRQELARCFADATAADVFNMKDCRWIPHH